MASSTPLPSEFYPLGQYPRGGRYTFTVTSRKKISAARRSIIVGRRCVLRWILQSPSTCMFMRSMKGSISSYSHGERSTRDFTRLEFRANVWRGGRADSRQDGLSLEQLNPSTGYTGARIVMLVGR